VAGITPKVQRQAAAVTRLALIRQGKTVFRDALWPGLELPLKMRVLSCSEVQVCHAAAVERFAKLKIPLNESQNFLLFQDEVLTQVLCLACRDAEDTSKMFAESADDLRDNTTVDERAAMYLRYRDFQAEVDPDPSEMDQELLGEILDLVKKKDEAGLRTLGSSTLASFILSMAARSSSSPTPRSGPGPFSAPLPSSNASEAHEQETTRTESSES